MFNESFAYLGNYICRESVRNLNKYMTEAEIANFSNNDYYYLTVINHLDRPKVSRVAEELGLTKPAISVLIRKLGKFGLIRKVQSETDKRVYYLEVTEKGKNVAQGDEALYAEISSIIMSLLNSEEQYRFVDKLLVELVEKLRGEEDEYTP